MKSNVEKIEMAMDLIQEARDLIDSVLNGDLEHFIISSNYYAYAEYGLKTAMGEGNPYDGKLQDIIDNLEEEEL